MGGADDREKRNRDHEMIGITLFYYQAARSY